MLIPYALILLQSILYGFGDPISKIAYEELPVFTLLTIRYALALALMILFFGKRIRREVKKFPVTIWIAPCLCIALCYVLSNVALVLTAATSVAFLRSLSVIMTPLLAWAVYREKFSRRHFPILAATILGLYLLCAKGGLSGFGAGEVVTLLSTLLMAGALVFGAKALSKMDSITLTALQIAVSTAVALICAVGFDDDVHLLETSAQSWLIIIYLAAACTLAGFLLQNMALVKISAKTVALIQCTCPIMTAIFSFILLGENLSTAGVIGATIILVCVTAEILFGGRRR